MPLIYTALAEYVCFWLVFFGGLQLIRPDQAVLAPNTWLFLVFALAITSLILVIISMVRFRGIGSSREKTWATSLLIAMMVSYPLLLLLAWIFAAFSMPWPGW